jgi:hypothetical protein
VARFGRLIRLDGTYPNPSAVAAHFAGTRLTWGAVADGDFLMRSGAAVVGSSMPGSLPPSGPAGGDLGATYPDPTVLAGQFAGTRLTWGAVADGDVLTRSGSAVVGVSPSTLGAPDGLALFSLCLADADGAIWSGSGGGAGNVYAAMVVAVNAVRINHLTSYCTQKGGGAGDTAMAIYRVSDRTKLGETGPVKPVVGLNKLPVTSSITLTVGEAYWFAIWCNRNGARFLQVSTRWTGAGSPSVGFECPNTSPPANVLTPTDFTSNKRDFRYWLAGSS